MALSPAQCTVLSDASSKGVVDALARVANYIVNERWLATNNKYHNDVVRQLKADTTGGGSPKSRHLSDYIAASVPLHLCDGWALLGGAVASHLGGDAATARHLAYYAELRATMALLASQGVGLFQDRHFIVDSSGRVALLTKSGTHEATWAVLQEWARGTAAGVLLGDIVAPGNRPIIDWLSAMPNGVAWQPVATDWLLALGLDLRVFSEDRTARNESSYRPTKLRLGREMEVEPAVRFAVDMWTLLEPGEQSSFGKLDRHMLRITLERAFKATEGRSARQAHRRFAAVVDAVTAANVGGADIERWRDFLIRKADEADPHVFTQARTNVSMANSEHHTGVMARALLLLRIATGATRRSLLDAGIGFDALRFWWGPVGSDRVSGNKRLKLRRSPILGPT